MHLFFSHSLKLAIVIYLFQVPIRILISHAGTKSESLAEKGPVPEVSSSPAADVLVSPASSSMPNLSPNQSQIANVLSPDEVPLVPSKLVSQSKEAKPPPTPVIGREELQVVPLRLKNNVDFWIKIYSQFDTNQGVIHDQAYIDRIYEVVDVKGLSRKQMKKKIKAAKARWNGVFKSLEKRRMLSENLDPNAADSTLTADEKWVLNLNADLSGDDRFRRVLKEDRLRFQLGQKDRFLDGHNQAGLYLNRMEKIFASYGLPSELIRLAYVESMFNLKARSKAGATGVWQFIRHTGRLYLRLNNSIDERNDPILSTDAAARLLLGNYQVLGNWALAITAYNHGTAGMKRAVQKLGTTDFSTIIDQYDGRRFGFASQNYFAEFLAALEVDRNFEKYFGNSDSTQIAMDPILVKSPSVSAENKFLTEVNAPKLAFAEEPSVAISPSSKKIFERLPEARQVEVELEHAIRLSDLVRYLGYKKDDLIELNPAWKKPIIHGQSSIPRGYVLRLPLKSGQTDYESAARIFRDGFSKIPKALLR